MKNKSTMLLVGIGVAYLLYRYFAKKPIAPVTTSEAPKLLYATDNLFEQKGEVDTYYPFDDNRDKINVPRELLIDKSTNQEEVLIPSTYQTYYGKITGTNKMVPKTC